MAVYVVCLALLLAMAAPSDASYCICRDGVSEAQLQKNIDYACGAGADCTPILQNGPCYNPNTVKDHCNYAVNSYYQKKGQTTGSCDFSGTATVSPNPPTATGSGCSYPSSPSNTGSPTTGAPPGGVPTGGVPTGGVPPGGTGTSTGGTATVPGSTTPGFSGLGPTGSGITNTDGSTSAATQAHTLLFLTLLISALICLWA